MTHVKKRPNTYFRGIFDTTKKTLSMSRPNPDRPFSISPNMQHIFANLKELFYSVSENDQDAVKTYIEKTTNFLRETKLWAHQNPNPERLNDEDYGTFKRIFYFVETQVRYFRRPGFLRDQDILMELSKCKKFVENLHRRSNLPYSWRFDPVVPKDEERETLHPVGTKKTSISDLRERLAHVGRLYLNYQQTLC
jgi:hypothetical protein